MTNYFFTPLTFDALSTAILYNILALRAEVFVVEQKSAYMDFDFLDQKAIHLCLMDGEKLIAYARLFSPGIKFEDASIGRIVVAPQYRGQGLGQKLVQRSIDELRTRFGNVAIRIEAQHHLRDFYADFGFSIVSDIYDWGGIPHVKMVCDRKAA